MRSNHRAAEGRDDHARQHRVFNAQTYRDWIGIGRDDVILGVAPLFHITGSIGHVALSLLTGAALVLTHRFDPAVAIEAIRDEKVTFTVGSITVFIALMNAPNADSGALATLTKIYSGGAPIPPSTVTAFQGTFGQYIHNIYGLTETMSPSHAVPLHGAAPVDQTSGALSVGVPQGSGDPGRAAQDRDRQAAPS
jgi:long-chain acyl-CoA synthetase